MSREPRKRILSSPHNQWETSLEEAEHAQPTQAGETEPGFEDGDGDTRLDADAGAGGYSGDAVLAGSNQAIRQPDRPLDREIHGDPRTYEGEGYPENASLADPNRKPVRGAAVGVLDVEDGEDVEDDEGEEDDFDEDDDDVEDDEDDDDEDDEEVEDDDER